MSTGGNENNGLMTKIWGPPMWKTFHSVTFGYPINPTEEQKKSYYCFFKDLGNTLPCKWCRKSYKEFINEGSSKLTMDTMKNRKTLSMWGYFLHEAVNNKLGVNYGVTYEDVVKKYESYRSKCSSSKSKQAKGCITPLNVKQNSFQIAGGKDCPIISSCITKSFVDYAVKQNIDKEYINFANNIEQNLQLKVKEPQKWLERNRKCDQIIKYMRENGIESIKDGMPTKEELKLILLGSSNLSKDKLIVLSNKLNKKKKRYVLRKD